MGDRLKSNIPVAGSLASALGLARLHDNHGNNTHGVYLTCAGSRPVELSSDEWVKLHRDIEWPHSFLAIRLDGVIPMLGGMESPLKTKCDSLRQEGRLHPHR